MTTDDTASVAPAARVIRVKIRPPVTDGWLERARPETLLADALRSRRVVVVSATAGSGKTTLVAAVTQRLERPAAWLTLDWTDTAPGRLVTYLEEALAVAVPRARGVARDALVARIPHPEAAGLLAEAMAGERVVLVVDELERLRDEPGAWAVIEALLRHAPADMRFVLCSSRRGGSAGRPPPDELVAERAEVALSDEFTAVSESVQLERALADAARLRGADRLDATLAALRVLDRGHRSRRSLRRPRSW